MCACIKRENVYVFKCGCRKRLLECSQNKHRTNVMDQLRLGGHVPGRFCKWHLLPGVRKGPWAWGLCPHQGRRPEERNASQWLPAPGDTFSEGIQQGRRDSFHEPALRGRCGQVAQLGQMQPPGTHKGLGRERPHTSLANSVQ